MAPSPTGEYHIGSMRTMLYNYALAKKEGGQFILRIEDTDRERFVEGATERLMDVINAYGLNWDEGPRVGGPHAPYIQSERLETYKEYANQLVESGHAYYCFCSKERLDTLREEQRKAGMPSTKYDKYCLNLPKDKVKENLDAGLSYVIRLNVQADQEISFDDKVLGHITFPSKDVDDQVLLKSDGFPTYHLGVVVDDHLMEVNWVMRGVEWLPSTPKHILRYKAFGWELPTYAHLPLLKEKGDTKKLSKRMGSVAAHEFLLDGYLPEALINFLMFLGWNPGTEKEIYSLDEFVKDFSVERIQKTDLVVFDRDKLAWYNGQYIRMLSAQDLWERLKKWMSEYDQQPEYKMEDTYSIKVQSLVQDRMRVFADFLPLTNYFYIDFDCPVELLVAQSGSESRAKEILETFYNLLKELSVENWHSKFLDELCHRIISEKGYKPKESFMTLRVASTGQTATPPIFDIIELLGQEKTLSRIENAKNLLK